MEKLLQHWEGYVIEISKDTFTARLCPIFGEGGDLEADIYKKYIPADHELEIGEIFDWKIGYKDEKEFSRIEFRPPEYWTQEQIDHANEQAKVWRVILNGF